MLHGRHSSDTGIDPYGSDTHHGLLAVNNHDTIEPGTGFDSRGPIITGTRALSHVGSHAM
jgi:hypothetical protein